MMSTTQSQPTPVFKLEDLQCHFTWDLDPSRSVLLHRRDKLEDVGTQEGNRWLGIIYNLRGFIQYKLGLTEDAQSLFNKAAEAFRQMRSTDEGPWLVVNYGNLAWLNHHLGDQAESQAYLAKIDTLMNKYPSPSQDELHPEIYAEKAWTLMKFSADKTLVADYLQRAIRMQPDMVEWNTSHIMFSNMFGDDNLEKLRFAKEQDPENLYLAVYYLEQCAKKGERIEDEARELARKILRNPVSSHSGIKGLLRLYRNYLSIDEAIDLAEAALENHPDERYLKKCAALYYKWYIYFSDSRPKQSTIDRAIILHKEVISLYPHTSLMKEIDLANIYARSSHSQAKAEQIYQELLERDLEPAKKQVLYNTYAKYLNFDRHDSDRSIQYHMKAAAIPQESSFRRKSIKVLEKNKDKCRNQMRRDIEELLENLQEPERF